MKREDYKLIKEEVKTMASSIKMYKKELRAKNRAYSLNQGCTHSELIMAISNYNVEKTNFRIKHIFMSLVRGRQRERIENTFAKKYVDSYVEKRIGEMCKKYGFDMTFNDKGQILSVTCKDDTEASLILEKKSMSEVQAVA